MSSLWTPYGEHEPRPERPAGDEPTPGAAGPAAGAAQEAGSGEAGPGETGPGEAEAVDPEALREMLGRLAATPVEAIVAQFAVELREIAALHLGLSAERPESLEQARLAVDAMGALVESLGERLGTNAQPLARALADVRLAFVEVSQTRTPSGADGGRDGS